MLSTHYDLFRCLGAECSDTCCTGWRVSVDRETYDKYQQCPDAEFQPRLRELVTINPEPTFYDFASIRSADSWCPFLSNRLCSIQQRLGPEYLSRTCANYPRLNNLVDGIQERSLDLSCPEAARLVLTDDAPISLEHGENASADLKSRELVLSILQDRTHSLSRRLTLVGEICDSSQASNELPANPTLQLKIILELIVERTRIEFTPQNYLELYKTFAAEIQINQNSTWDEMGARYAAAYRKHYLPGIREHDRLLERYLACYAHKTQFPLGSPVIRRLLNTERISNPMAAQYLVMMSYYAITRAVMIGLAARHKSAFSTEHVIQAIQSCSRTLEHCTPFAERIVDVLASRSIADANRAEILNHL